MQNPASNNGAETFTHAWHAENISNVTSPQQLPIIESGGVEKVDNALNLAIVFHQHQPYYKNKLTGMYEMPVRVHAMTEYVDSPGILAATDTSRPTTSSLRSLNNWWSTTSTKPWTCTPTSPSVVMRAATPMPRTSNFTRCSSSRFGTAVVHNVSSDEKLGWLAQSRAIQGSTT